MKAVPSDLQSDPFDRSGNPPVDLGPYHWSYGGLTRIHRARSQRVANQSHRDELAEGLEPTTC